MACLRDRLGPLSTYCVLETPAADGGPSCVYLKASTNETGVNITLGDINRNATDPDFGPSAADIWIYFTRSVVPRPFRLCVFCGEFKVGEWWWGGGGVDRVRNVGRRM